MKVVAFVLAVACVACGPYLPAFPLYMRVSEAGFTECELEQIVVAVDHWREATNGVADVRLEFVERSSDADHDSIVPVWSWSDGVDSDALGYSRRRNFWDESPGRIEMVVDRIRFRHDRTLFLSVILHELGHHYGLALEDDHPPKGTLSVMTEEAARLPCVRPYDVQRFCEVRGCVAPFVTECPKVPCP